MTGKNPPFAPALAIFLMVALFSGCTSPTPAPATPAPTASVPPALSPVPPPIGGSDEAHIEFYYTVKQYSQMYEGIPAGPGEHIYAFDVYVDSDKPVKTDGGWFAIEYRKNGTAALDTYPPATVIGYPSRTIGDGSGPAQGRLLVVLPAPGQGAYGPVPVYYKPASEQVGTYKVKVKAYGVIRTT